MKAPRGYKEIVEAFGDPALWVQGDGTPHPSWSSQMTTVDFPTPLPLGWDRSKRATRARVHNRIAHVVEHTFRALDDAGAWALLRTYDGGYTWREKRGSRKMSTHAWGISLDFDAHWNRLGTKGDMHPEVLRIFRAHDWQWGGRWRRRDPMHHQFAKGY